MITLKPQASFSGVFTSGGILIPPGAATVILQGVMNSGDISTPGHSVGLCIGQMIDYRTMGHAGSYNWQSGGASGPYLSIPLGLNVVAITGQMTVPQPLSIGLTLDIQDAQGNSLLISTPSGNAAMIPVPVPVPQSGSLF